MMNSRVVVGAVTGLLASAVVAQEPHGWKQPLLQPTLPPKIIGSRSSPEWKMPLVHPALPPIIAGQALVKQHHQLYVPQPGTNGLRMAVTNFIVIVPGTNQSSENYVRNWEPQVMYPSYPPKLAPIQSLGLLDLR
jgi:hypothetical protein